MSILNPIKEHKQKVHFSEYLKTGTQLSSDADAAEETAEEKPVQPEETK